MQRINMIGIGLLGLVFQCSTLACDTVVESKTDLVRLDGHDPLPKYPEVYIGGFKVSFTLSSKSANASDILVDNLRLEVRAFTPGSRPDYSYKMGEVYGAGPPTPRKFSVTLNGKEVSRATWIKGTTGIVAKSENFLDTKDTDFQTFKVPSTQPVRIDGTILAFKAGVYDLALLLGYRTDSGRGVCVLSNVRVYQDRDD